MKSVLFIDIRNSTRSQIAEAMFNDLANGWGQASSCGTMPSRVVNRRVVQVLREAGVDMRRAHPKMVNQQLLARSDIVVIIGKDLHPAALSPNYIWDIPDLSEPSPDQVRALCNKIRQNVIVLLEDIRLESIEIESVSTQPQWESLMQVVLTH